MLMLLMGSAFEPRALEAQRDIAVLGVLKQSRPDAIKATSNRIHFLLE